MPKWQVKQGTAAQWSSANPVLAQGEFGLETDTLFVKVGNGSTAWNSLPYGIQRKPYSRAVIAASTVFAQASVPAVMGAILSAGTTAPTHTFASDGITVPPGDYICRTTLAWNAAANTTIRGEGVFDGSDYYMLAAQGTYLLTTSVQWVTLAAATKLQPAYICDTTTAASRTLSGSVVSSFTVSLL